MAELGRPHAHLVTSAACGEELAWGMAGACDGAGETHWLHELDVSPFFRVFNGCVQGAWALNPALTSPPASSPPTSTPVLLPMPLLDMPSLPLL